jgi:signal transduction histidine kinase
MVQNNNLTPEILVPRLGDYLVERGLISQQDLSQALLYQKTLRERGEVPPLLGQLLIERGAIQRIILDQAVTEQILQLRSALTEANQGLQAANAQLEQRVLERTAELQKALKKLAELDKLKTNFIANMSHELRTPMTHIRGYLELLVARDLGALTEEQAQALEVMQRASDRLERLIEDLLMFSLGEKNQIFLNNQPVNVSTICNLVKARIESKAVESKINLKFVVPSDLPPVQADQDKITWVLLQLLDNAIKFTPSGGKVLLRAEQQNNNICFAIMDTGIGIPMDKMDEIFEPFHQLDGSSTRRYGGTGLGLALVRRIIEAHGAEIIVKSKPGHGSQFIFKLPVSERPVSPFIHT